MQRLGLWDCLSSPCCHVIKLKWLFTRLTQISKIIPKSWFPPHLHPPRHGARGDGDIALIPRGSQAHAHAILRGGSYQTCKRCLVENEECDTWRKYLVAYSHNMNLDGMCPRIIGSGIRIKLGIWRELSEDRHLASSLVAEDPGESGELTLSATLTQTQTREFGEFGLKLSTLNLNFSEFCRY